MRCVHYSYYSAINIAKLASVDPLNTCSILFVNYNFRKMLQFLCLDLFSYTIQMIDLIGKQHLENSRCSLSQLYICMGPPGSPNWSNRVNYNLVKITTYWKYLLWSRFVGIAFTLLALTFLFRQVVHSQPRHSSGSFSEGKQMNVCSTTFLSSVTRRQGCILYILGPSGKKQSKTKHLSGAPCPQQ